MADLSRRQFGVVARPQLLGAGFSDSAVRRAVERGDLVPQLPKVYRLPSVPVTLEQRHMGAVLWAGPGAALCNSSAAQALGLIGRRSSQIEIVTARRPIPQPGIRLHRRLLSPGEVRHVGALPVVAPCRTLIDLAGSGTAVQAEIALDAALRLELVTLEEMAAMVDLAALHRLAGNALMRALLSVRGEEEALSESELESAFVRIIRRVSFPRPVRQVTVEWGRCHRLDFVFPDQGVIVEVDGRRWHASKRRFEEDRRRDNAATLGGMKTIRLTWKDVIHDEPYVVDTVGRALGIIPLLRRS